MENCVFNTELFQCHHQITFEPSEGFQLHCHNSYEVYHYISGDVSYLVEGRRYELKSQCVLLLAPHVFHGVRIESSRPYERFAIHFHPAALSQENVSLLLHPFQSASSGVGIYFANTELFCISSYFEDILSSISLEEDIRNLAVQIRLENLLIQILHMSRKERGISLAPQNDTILKVLQYLNAHLDQKITLDSLAQKFYLNKYHLNAMFRRSTGTTVIDYLIHKRLANAHQLLSEGITAAEAAERSGFRDYSTFFREYKRKYGIAPSDTVLFYGDKQNKI